MFSYFLIIGQVLLATFVQSNSFCGFGQRLDNDFLLLKDELYSRPAGNIDPAGISFKYNIAEPITYIHIESEKDMFANVKLSYIENLVGGLITLVHNDTEDLSTEFDVTDSPAGNSAFNVTIQIFGFNLSLVVNEANLLSRDMSYESKLEPDLIAEYEDELEDKDKIITIGERQEGDGLIYEISQSSKDESTEQTNYTVVLYYIDSAFITYVKFVIGDHFANKLSTDEDYLPPVAEYSHFSAGTLKATITEFHTRHLFVQMFIYGYIGLEAPPNYKPFLPGPHWSRTVNTEEQRPQWTPLQKLQLEIMTGKKSTQSPHDAPNDNSEDDSEEQQIRPEDMVPDHIPNGGAIADQRTFVEQRLYAMMGMMLFAVA